MARVRVVTEAPAVQAPIMGSKQTEAPRELGLRQRVKIRAKEVVRMA